MHRVSCFLLFPLVLIACAAIDEEEVDAVEERRSLVERRDRGVDDLAQREPDQCPPGTDDWGCPGMPCLHGWCRVGACVGTVVDEDGQTLDPGLCCTDEECDAQ